MRGQTPSWLTVKQIAAACGCPIEAVEALARRSYWPRISGSDGAKFAVDIELVRSALADGVPRRHGRT